MKLEEAIKSDKSFKRPHHVFWLSHNPLALMMLSKEDILADDWEVMLPCIHTPEMHRLDGSYYLKEKCIHCDLQIVATSWEVV